MGSRLYQLPPETEIGIEVPMDAIGPFRVSHGHLTVMVTGAQLMVETEEDTFPGLERAMRVARRGMESLPETPVAAAGFNVRAQGSGEDGNLGPMSAATQRTWDGPCRAAGSP